VGRRADAHVAPQTAVVTDGLASYNATSLGARPHNPVVPTKAERKVRDTLQGVHWTMSLLKRWLLGTHGDGVQSKHLQAYLDEFAFRHNRGKTKGVGRIAARTLQQLVVCAPMTRKMLVKETLPCRAFLS
jgi:transposase-like protein